jgi:trans-aconitate 2-methyltransferase
LTIPAGGWDGSRYDRLAGPQTGWGTAVLDRLRLRGDETVLDAGCGSGRVTEALLRRLPRGRVIALDSSQSMLREARRRLSGHGDRVRFLHRDLLELSPADLHPEGAVDAVLSTATFHWVADHDRLFAGIRAVLRPGGQLVAQCGGRGNIANLIEVVRSLGMERAGTWLYASPEETADRLRRAGFVAIQVWSHPQPTPFSDQQELVDFLEAVCLHEHLATLPVEGRRSFVVEVATRLPGQVLDYVRLNILARRPSRG